MVATDGALELAGLPGVRRPTTIHEMVRDTMRLAILSGRLPRGTHLVQADLADQLGVSTTPVREALRDLAGEGLVQFDPHRGAVVHEPDEAELIDVYEIRKVLEPFAIQLAAQRISPAQLIEAERQLRVLEQEADIGAWVIGNLAFHETLERASGSARLATLVRTVQNSASLFVAQSLQTDPGRIERGNAEHRAILAAVSAGDGDKAAVLLRAHLDSTLQAVLEDRP